MLNVRTVFNGLNNMAIDNDGITIKISVDYDPVTGDPINTRWDVVEAKDVDVPEYIIGVLRDFETLPSKFFDASGKYPRFIAERKPTAYEPKTSRERKYSKSAFQRMFDAFELAIPLLTDEHLSVLTDLNQTKKLTGVALPLLIEVDLSVDIEEAFAKQTYFAKKNRYLKKPLTIAGRQFWITNHIFDRNIPKIKEMLTSMVGIKYLPDESEIDEKESAAFNVIMNMIAENKLPSSVLVNSNSSED